MAGPTSGRDRLAENSKLKIKAVGKSEAGWIVKENLKKDGLLKGLPQGNSGAEKIDLLNLGIAQIALN